MLVERRLITMRRLNRPAAAREMWAELTASAIYFSLAIYSATHHRLWFDELNTALLSRLPLGELWRALASGADTNPPLLYWPVHLLNGFTSNIELACRLPSIVEFFLLMSGIYWIARRYVSPLYAVIGSLVPLMTIAGSYATEARGYAATLGFSAIALLCWRNAAIHRKRLGWLVGMAACAAAAIANHYSATLIISALLGGEAVRSISQKRIDWPVFGSIAAGGLPLVICRPLMLPIHRYLASYWAKPSLYEMFSALNGWRLAGIFLALLFLIRLFQARRDPAYRPAGLLLPIPGYELTAWIILLMSPVQGFLQGLLTGGFTMRYALPMVIPIALFISMYAFRTFRGSALPGFVLLAILICNCAEKLYVVTVRPIVSGQEASWIEKTISAGTREVVIGNPVLFSPLYFYAGAPLRSRLAYVSSPELSTHYLHMNSPDLNLSELSKFSAMPVYEYESFMRKRKPFTAVIDDESWLLNKLADDRVPFQKLGCENRWCLYTVTPSRS